MDLLIKGAEAQFIDTNGKLRMLFFPGATLMTSPLPPLTLPVRDQISVLKDFDKLNSFLKEKKLTPLSQVSDDKATIGLWVTHENLVYGYIPVELPRIKSVEMADAHMEDPIRKDVSALDAMNNNRRIANSLKDYALFIYSTRLHSGFTGVKDVFIIDPTVEYDIRDLKILSLGNKIVRDNKLVVSSKTMADRLANYIKVQLLNDTTMVENYRHNIYASSYYTNVSDFDTRPNEIIFSTMQSARRWKREFDERPQNIIVSKLRPDAVDPYFYQHPNVMGGRIVMIQNVLDGDLLRAVAVSGEWIEKHKNVGYLSDGKETDSYNVYTDVGLPRQLTLGAPNIISYNDGTYGAILAF